MARSRKQDTEALEVARSIAREVHASEEAKQTGVIIGARAFRRGTKSRDPYVNRLEDEVSRLREELAELRRHSTVFTPAEIGYITTLCEYGMAREDVARIMGVSAKSISAAIALGKDKTIRYASDRKRSVPGTRSLDAD